MVEPRLTFFTRKGSKNPAETLEERFELDQKRIVHSSDPRYAGIPYLIIGAVATDNLKIALVPLKHIADPQRYVVREGTALLWSLPFSRIQKADEDQDQEQRYVFRSLSEQLDLGTRLILCDMRDSLLIPPHMKPVKFSKSQSCGVAYYPKLTDFSPVPECSPFAFRLDSDAPRILKPYPNGEYSLLSRRRIDGTQDYVFMRHDGAELLTTAGVTFTRISHLLVAAPETTEQGTAAQVPNIREAYNNFTRIVRKEKGEKN